MAYRSSEKTRRKKDVKRTEMMKAAVRVFAEKGYHSATVRDIVQAAEVAIGTFYFYFPDKETLFVHLYEETAEFVVGTISQALQSRETAEEKVVGAIRTYVNIAVYEPAVVHLLLVGGVGAIPSLTEKHLAFRQKYRRLWQQIVKLHAPAEDSYRIATGVAGAVDEMVLDLLSYSDPEAAAETAVLEMSRFVLQAMGATR